MENKFTELAGDYGVMLKKMPNGYQFRDDKSIINYYDSTGTVVMHIKGEGESVVSKKAGMFFLKECLNDCFGVKPKSLNDQYAEIEQVRQDSVNNPSHYASGDIECIDAIESSMTPEAFRGYCKGNVQKYIWRYEQKGGKESLEKAQWYLNRLLGTF